VDGIWTGDSAASATPQAATSGSPIPAPNLAADATCGPTTTETIVSAAFETHREMVYRRALTVTHNEAAAEDVVQDTFARLLIEVRGGRLPENMGGWLHRVATNAVISRARHENVERRYEPALIRPRVPASPEEAVEQREHARALGDALSALPVVDRTAILLAANGASSADIARHLGRTELAARSVLCRARARLRRDLAPA
jgi:RNA polymerase sigma-70 factor (ECF subfamily)